MVNISMKLLLEAGAHFGHQTRRWNPKMAKYIFGSRNGIHIVDLQKTVKELKKACKFVRDAVAAGKTILFVGTKKQAQEVVKTEAQRCGAYFVVERWLGGTLTNFSTIRNTVLHLQELQKMKDTGLFEKLSKKEVARKQKELNRLQKTLEGIVGMDKIPGILFVIDIEEEATAVAEARKLNIPLVAICDTNVDPDLIDYPIPGNDDAIRSIKAICGLIADAVLEGKGLLVKQQEEEEEKKSEGEQVRPDDSQEIVTGESEEKK